ncbi:unnamed protein product, partial [Thlaspi arvense]
MIPLTLSSPSLNRLVLFTSRYSHSPLLRSFKSLPLIHRTLPHNHLLGVRCHASSSSGSSSFTAKPSKEIRRARTELVVDEKLSALRKQFSEPGVGIDAYIIPSQDAHQSEFIAECYARRAFISGFTGSAGTAVVTKDKAALWTDGRYFLQAEKQLNTSWILMRAGNPGVPTASEWVADVLAPGGRVGIDPFLFSADAAEELKEAIAKKNHELVYLYDANLVDEIWKGSRPNPPSKQIRVHDLKYAGVDVASKLAALRNEIMDAGASSIVISMLDEIAWVLNLRGSDVPHSPVVYAYLIVEVDQARLFVDSSKVTAEVKDHLKNAGIELSPYDSILSEIDSLAARGAQLLMDPSTLNVAIISTYISACEKHSRKSGNEDKAKTKFSVGSSGYPAKPSGIYRPSPISWAKAIKNDAELQGMKNSHLRDAAALAHFWAWLEEEVHKNVNLTEVDVADRLLEFRSMQDGFMDTSFDTISGSGANGAIIHYKPEPESCSGVDPQKLFLLDSGAQYVDGTTDITRTVHFSEPSAREKECFTRVLQGHIALDQAVFPEGTPGFVLDGFARSSLWKIGLDYRHGQTFSRNHNLLHVKDAETPNRFGGATYLGFEKLTFFPIQTKMVDVSLLSHAEIDWLNNYHAEVWEKVSPLLEGPTQQWLWNNTLFEYGVLVNEFSMGDSETDLSPSFLLVYRLVPFENPNPAEPKLPSLDFSPQPCRYKPSLIQLRKTRLFCLVTNMIHALAILSGYDKEISVGNTLITAYFKCGCSVSGRRVFDEMPQRNVITWTAVISGLMQNELHDDGLRLFSLMRRGLVHPNSVTYLSALSACSGSQRVTEGKQIHALLWKSGIESELCIESELMDMYSKSGSIEDAWKIFESTEEIDQVSMTVMLVGLAQNGSGEESIHFFIRMLQADTMECLRLFTSIPKISFFSNSRNSTSRRFILSCRERSRDDPLSSSSPYSILGVDPSCSSSELKAAFRAKVKQYHPDVNREESNSDIMIRRIIQAYEMLTNYSRSEIIEGECLDPFDHPECEALDVFVNEVLCVGTRCSYPCFKTAPQVFSCASGATARAMSQGHGEDSRVQTAVNQCPRNCIHYVTPSQRIILEELLDSVLDKPYDCSAEAELLYALIVKAQFENNRYQKPKKKQPESSTKHGHIALDQAVFLEGTPGFVLDGFARSSLWKIGLDYRHGTGHGIGAALNVHVGPQKEREREYEIAEANETTLES